MRECPVKWSGWWQTNVRHRQWQQRWGVCHECWLAELRCTLAKTFKIWEQIVHQHGYILIIHFISVGISCINAILPSRVYFNVIWALMILLKWTYIKQGSSLVQQKIPYKSRSSLQLWKRRSNIYPSFLSGSAQFFLFTLLFFISVLCSLWRGQLGHYSLDMSLNLSDQVRADTAPVRGRGTAQYVLGEGGCCQQGMHENDWHFSDTWLWLVMLIRECWFLANQIRDSPTDSGFLHSWPVSYTTVRIIMTILANITKK